MDVKVPLSKHRQGDTPPLSAPSTMKLSLDTTAMLPGQLLAPSLPLVPSLGPMMQLHGDFADLNIKWIDFGLRSGKTRDAARVLNVLSLLAFDERLHHAQGRLLRKIPFLLESLLLLVIWEESAGNGSFRGENFAEAEVTNELFSPADTVQDEKIQMAVAASNIIRTLSFSPENGVLLASSQDFLETLLTVMEKSQHYADELVTNVIDAFANVAAQIDLRSGLNSPEEVSRTSCAICSMLDSPVKAWHHSVSEALARLATNPANESFLKEVGPELFGRFCVLIGQPDQEVQAAAVLAVAAFAELGPASRVHLGQEEGMIARLVGVIRAPHPVVDICRRAGSVLENLAAEESNRARLLAFEQQVAEIAFSESKCAEHMSRLLYELSREESRRHSAPTTVWMA